MPPYSSVTVTVLNDWHKEGLIIADRYIRLPIVCKLFYSSCWVVGKTGCKNYTRLLSLMSLPDTSQKATEVLANAKCITVLFSENDPASSECLLSTYALGIQGPTEQTLNDFQMCYLLVHVLHLRFSRCTSRQWNIQSRHNSWCLYKQIDRLKTQTIYNINQYARRTAKCFGWIATP